MSNSAADPRALYLRIIAEAAAVLATTDKAAALAAVARIRVTRAAFLRLYSEETLGTCEAEIFACSSEFVARWTAQTDCILPATWDYTSDLVLLFGTSLAPLAQALRASGQRRVLLIDTTMDCAVDALENEIAGMVDAPPFRLVTRLAADVDRDTVCKLTQRALDTMADLRSSRDTRVSWNKLWTEQGLRNSSVLATLPTIDDMAHQAGKAIVIVAPGPSLADNLRALAAARDKVLILASSHALLALTKAGIVPDYVLTTESQDVRYHFAGTDMSSVPMLNVSTAHPALFSLGTAYSLCANTGLDQALFAAMGQDAFVGGGGGVVTAALQLALRWKCDPILMVGVDLCFRDGAVYCDGSVDGDAMASIDTSGALRVVGASGGYQELSRACGQSDFHQTATLPGVDGKPVPTTQSMAWFHRYLEQQAADCDATVYNCTLGGAAIGGMEHASLPALLRELEPISETRVPAGLSGQEVERRVRALLVWLEEQEDQVEACSELASRGAALTLAGVGPLALIGLAGSLHELLGEGYLSHLCIVAWENFVSLSALSLDSDRTAACTSWFEQIEGLCIWLQPLLREARASALALRNFQDEACPTKGAILHP